jgi:hypothetical protein
MAVTIEEMHVEVQDAPRAPSTPAPSEEPKKDVNLHEAIEMLHERKLRLRAD